MDDMCCAAAVARVVGGISRFAQRDSVVLLGLLHSTRTVAIHPMLL